MDNRNYGVKFKINKLFWTKYRFRYFRNRSRVFFLFFTNQILFSFVYKNPSRRRCLHRRPDFSNADEADLVNMESNGSVSSMVNLEKFLCERLVDQSQPISERFRALFSLRNLKGPGPRNALILGLF